MKQMTAETLPDRQKLPARCWGRLTLFITGPHLAFALRLALGAMFLVAAAGKLPLRSQFAEVIVAYQIVPAWMARPYGLVLPWLELFVGAALVLGARRRWAATLSVMLTLTFVVANAVLISRGIKDAPCSCFGSLLALAPRQIIWLDMAMILAGVLIFFSRREFLSVEDLLRRIFKSRRG